MKLLLTVAVTIFFQLGHAQNLKPTREAFTLKLAVDGEKFYEEDLKSSAYFPRPGLLQIYPTEKLNIEVEIKADTVFSMQVVKNNLNPSKTIEIVFSQTVENNKHELMMLKVNNPFEKELSYKARMYVVGQEKWSRTSILPIPAKLSGYETWPNVIISLALYDFMLK
jgi:hypothetical protein